MNFDDILSEYERDIAGVRKASTLGALLAHGNRQKPRVKEKTISREEFLGQKETKAPPPDYKPHTRKYLERMGYEPVRVQMYNAYTGHANDFLGLFDFLGLKAGEPDLGVQICGLSQLGTHETEMCSETQAAHNLKKKINNLRFWLSCGKRAVIWAWSPGAREPVVRELTLDNIAGAIERAQAKAARKAARK